MNDKINKGKYRKRLFILPLIMLLSLPCWAVNTAPVQMADGLRSSGKIYVVVLVIVTIFIGIILTLLYLERKVKKLENQQ